MGTARISLEQMCNRIQSNIPRIDVEVLREICSQACSWRRPADGVDIEVIWLRRSRHANIAKVERIRTVRVDLIDLTNAILVKDRSVSPCWEKRRLHGSEW